MAFIRKYSDRWIAEVRRKGFSKSKTFATKAEAQAWALAVEQAHGKHGGVVHGHTLGDALQRYCREILPGRKGGRWELISAERIGRTDIANILLSDLSPKDFQDRIARELARGIKASSVNRELNTIGSALKAARLKWKWLERDIMREVERPKNPPPRDRIITDKERDRILMALGYDDASPVANQRHKIAVAFLLALETAMRQGEIWAMRWEHVRLKERFVTLPDTKNGTRRDVPLSSRAVALLEKLSPGNDGAVMNCPQESSGAIFRGACKLAGVHGVTFHDSRHTAITALARKIDVLDLARMVGHRDLRSLQIYYNPTASDIANRLG
jgi:integrase